MIPKATARAITALDNLENALVESGITHDPAGMTDDAINRVVDAAYTANAALTDAGGPLKNTADKLRSA